MDKPEIIKTAAGMGYQTAYNRARCDNCFHLDRRYTHESSPVEREYTYCGLGGFEVNKNGICPEHQRRA